MFRVIFHLDMDAFYASIEQRDHPAWRGKPVVVGASPDRRGVVCAASYEARRFGVRSAMPSSTARRLCASAIFVEPRMEHYRSESARIMEIATGFSAEIEQVSIDEAYLDVSPLCQAIGADESLLESISIARGLKDEVGSFGPVLKRFAFGDDDRPLELGGEAKSISSENTFSRDTDDRQVLRQCLREQSAEIAEKLERKELGAETVQVKVRYSDFRTLTRQITMEEPVTLASEIYRLGCYLLARDRLVAEPLRLIGLGVTNLSRANRQLRLPL